MARITGWRKIVINEPDRFEIIFQDPASQSVEITDRITKTAYMVQAAGKVEYQTILSMSQERMVQFVKTIEG